MIFKSQSFAAVVIDLNIITKTCITQLSQLIFHAYLREWGAERLED